MIIQNCVRERETSPPPPDAHSFCERSSQAGDSKIKQGTLFLRRETEGRGADKWSY